MHVSHNQATLVGTPLGCTDSIDAAISVKVKKLKLMGERLCHLSKKDLLLLFRHSLAIPKLLYLLRTAPWSQSQLLGVLDEVQRSILSLVLDADLNKEEVWAQASLPGCIGGLGVRKASQLAPSAYLTSAAGCLRCYRKYYPHLP